MAQSAGRQCLAKRSEIFGCKRTSDIKTVCEQISAGWKNSCLNLSKRVEKIYQRAGMKGHVDTIDQQYFLSALYSTVRTIKPVHIVETGTFIGCSSVAMACALEDNGSEGIIETIDPQPHRYGKIFIKDPVTVAKAAACSGGFSDRIIFHQGYSVKPLDSEGQDIPNVPKGILFNFIIKKQTDFLVIDGDHTYDGVYWDLEIGHKILSPDGPGMIFVHDYKSIPTVRRAVREWTKLYKPAIELRSYNKNCGFALIQCKPGLLRHKFH